MLFPDVETLTSTEITNSINGVQAVCIIGAIQLACRHRLFVGPSRKVAEDFARELQRLLIDKCPGAEFVLEAGWNPDFDIH